MAMTIEPATVASQIDLKQTRASLRALHRGLRTELDETNAAVVDIARAADHDGDEVDAGAKAAYREHQISLVASISDRLAQVERALERLEAGSYGTCEECGEMITPERLEVFPSATSCVTCKQAGERR